MTPKMARDRVLKGKIVDTEFLLSPQRETADGEVGKGQGRVSRAKSCGLRGFLENLTDFCMLTIKGRCDFREEERAYLVRG